MFKTALQRIKHNRRRFEIHVRDTGGKQLPAACTQHPGVKFEGRNNAPVDVFIEVKRPGTVAHRRSPD